MTAFWTIHIWGQMSLMDGFWQLFSGSSVPLNLLVKVWNGFNFAYFLPFATFYYLPTQILLNKLTQNQIFISFGILISWCIFLYFLAKLVFKLGLKRNESVGL